MTLATIAYSETFPGDSISYLGGDTAGIYVTTILAFLLAYLTVVKASKRDFREIQLLLAITSIPLLFTFGSIIITESLKTLQFI
ncbi:hypothetical protein [Halobacteriaceae bacterium SHR40]|uniref:hypothetical protein n=1 Tax=Halovenus amylolytica TaxID=2500550 RepID=UPI000FE3B657